MVWTIRHIFDGDYGCEENAEPTVTVTLESETGERREQTAADSWLRRNGLDVGSVWPLPLTAPAPKKLY